ncbi:MAG: hypothetical protein ACPHDJ_07350, partial [Candidatus Puniceispirillaceae bacterium]
MTDGMIAVTKFAKAMVKATHEAAVFPLNIPVNISISFPQFSYFLNAAQRNLHSPRDALISFISMLYIAEEPQIMICLAKVIANRAYRHVPGILQSVL